MVTGSFALNIMIEMVCNHVASFNVYLMGGNPMFQKRLPSVMKQIFLACCLLALNAPVLAETFDNNRKEIHRGGSAVMYPVVITSLTTFKAGERIPAHYHHGIETAYVIQGAELLADNGGISKMETGETIFDIQNKIHGGVTIGAKSELRLFTVHIVDRNKPLYNCYH